MKRVAAWVDEWGWAVILGVYFAGSFTANALNYSGAAQWWKDVVVVAVVAISAVTFALVWWHRRSLGSPPVEK